MRTEDGHVIYKCLNGEPIAYGLLVDKYKESIYALAYSKLGNFHDAEDVTQEVFIKAYQKLRTLKQRDSFLAWLYSITSNLCKNWVRTQSRRPDRHFIEDQESAKLDYPSLDSYHNDIAHESLYDTLHEALDLLPEIYRQAVSLYYLGDMNTREIAKFLGTSANVIEQRLKRARAKLKEEMIAMMTARFKQGKLQAGFTFRLLEMIKHVKIQQVPRIPWLPWGIPVASSVLIAVISITLNLVSFNPTSTGSMLTDYGLLNDQPNRIDVGGYIVPYIHKGEMLNYANIPITLEVVSAKTEKKSDKPANIIQGETQKPEEKQASMGIVKEGPVILQMKPWIGEEQTYRMGSESKVTMPTGWIITTKAKADTTNICLGVDKNGDMTVVRLLQISEPEQTMENIPPDQAKMLEEVMKQTKQKSTYLTKAVTISRMRPDGAIIGNTPIRDVFAITLNGQFSSNDMQLPMFPDKPVNIGESWTAKAVKPGVKGDTKINIKNTLIGFDEIMGQKCAKIQSEMTVNMPQVGEVKINSTNYFSVEDGLSVKSVDGGEYQIPNQGTTKMSQTTELIDRKKLTSNELKVIQAEADELEIAFGYMQKDNDSAQKTLQQFVDTHPQSRLKEGVEGIITYMSTMKKMREKLEQKPIKEQEQKVKEMQSK
jgi:RNA polymerase sigma factor (sigma-70 family)